MGRRARQLFGSGHSRARWRWTRDVVTVQAYETSFSALGLIGTCIHTTMLPRGMSPLLDACMGLVLSFFIMIEAFYFIIASTKRANYPALCNDSVLSRLISISLFISRIFSSVGGGI